MFEVFSNVSYCEDERFIKDLKLPDFFSLFLDTEAINRIVQFLNTRPNKEEVLKRQEFFKEVLFNEAFISFFQSVRYNYQLLKRENADCTSYHNSDISTFFLLKAYSKIVLDLCGAAQTIAPKSALMVDFVHKWLYLSQSSEFAQLQKSLADIERELYRLKKTHLSVQFQNARTVSCKLLPNKFNENSFSGLSNVLSDFLSQMGIDLPEPPSRKILSGNHRYYHYLSLLSEKEPNLKKLLLKLRQVHIQILDSIHRATITDVLTVLDIYAVLGFLCEKGIEVSFPQVLEQKSLSLFGMKDITLLTQKNNIVGNQCVLAEDEHNVFLFGANGGGKTSYIRAVGICSLFARCGLFIPAKAGRVPLFQNFFSFFARNENLGKKESRFQKEQSEILKMVQEDTTCSFLLFNETYSSTDEQRASPLLEELSAFNMEHHNLAFYVTHFQSVIRNCSYEHVTLSCLVDEFGNNTYQFKRIDKAYSTVYSILDKYELTEEKIRAMEMSI